MPRYIDADKLIEELQPAKNAEWNKNDHSASRSEMIEDFCTELKNAPVADVVPKSQYDLAVAEREANVKGFTEQIEQLSIELKAMRGAANSYKMHYESAQREVATLEKEIKALVAFKEYFSELYGQGLDIAKWHENGTLEPFDNFYDAAEDEYENAKERAGKDTNTPTKVSSGDICVVCGEHVPEGRQICSMCEVGQEYLKKRKGGEFGE